MLSKICSNCLRKSVIFIGMACLLYITTLQERVIYNKEVQTTAIETETPTFDEDELRQRIYREKDVEAERVARDKELEEESVKLEKEIEQEIRGACFSCMIMSSRLELSSCRAFGGGASQHTCRSRIS